MSRKGTGRSGAWLFALVLVGCGSGSGGTGGGTPVLFPDEGLFTGVDDAGGKYKVPVAASGAQGVAWTSADPSIATVSGGDDLGTVVAQKAGTTTISAQAGGTATVMLTVTAYKAADKTAGAGSYMRNTCDRAGCHDASGPDITPSGIAEHADDLVLAAVTDGMNPEGGEVSIGKAAHSFSDASGIVAYLRSIAPRGRPQADQ